MAERNRQSTSRRACLKAIGAGSVFATTGLAGCMGGGGSTTLKTAVMTPFSGSISWLGPSTKKGAEVALADLEKVDGIDGVGDIEIRSSDTEYSPSTGLQTYQNLDAQDYHVVFGTTSTVMVSMIETVKDVKLPVLCPGGTTRLNPVNTKWMWRTQSPDNVGGIAQSLFAQDNFGDRLGVVTVNERGPRSFAEAVATSFENLGGTVVDTIEIQPGASSYRSAVQQVQGMDVDVVTLAGSVDATALFLNNYNDLGAEFPMMLSNDASSEALFEKIDAESIPTVYGQVSGAGPANDYFTSRYQEVHGESVASLAQQGYDSMLLIAAAVQQAGEVDREAIVNQFGRQPEDTEQSVSNPPGATVTKANEIKSTLEDEGSINLEGASTGLDYDAQKNVWGGIRILNIQNGSWELETTYDSSQIADARQ